MPTPTIVLSKTKNGRLFDDKERKLGSVVLKLENASRVSLVSLAFSRPVLATDDSPSSINNLLLACIDQLGHIYKIGLQSSSNF